MALINSIVLVGNLTRDAEIKYTNGGTASVRFGIAQNRRKKQGEQWVDEPMFFDISMMGKSAEAVHKFLVKGKQVAIQGELRQDRWEKDGQPQSKVYIFCFSLQLLGGGRDGAPRDSGGWQSSNSQGGSNQQQGSGSYDSYGGNPESFEDDIPF